jgi:phage/plasmid-like protein (TIGR03299 family)
MSRETMEWLNVQTLIGFTEKRGTAWHYRESLQGDEPNHYPGAIPVDDILRRLFDFEVVEVPLTYTFNDVEHTTDRKLMVADDNGDLLGVFKEGYQGHSYKEWLLDKVASIIDDSLNIGSAGLLKNRAQAWVSIEMPDSLKAEGVEFRPHLIACTSFDGSLATTYKRAIQFVVCDNTLAQGLGEAGQVFKVRHSRYSNAKLADVRDALEIVHTMGEDFAEELAALASWPVTDKAFERHVELMVPKPSEEGRAMTTATKKQNQIIQLWREDERVAPWRGTALGVVQAYNTWNHHFQSVRGGASRGQRNMENVINGRFATQDQKVLAVLADVAPAVVR